MITETEERPTAAELIQKHRQEVFTRYKEFIEDIDRRLGNRVASREEEMEIATDNLIFNYFCFPYFEMCITWKCDNFPSADVEYSAVTPFNLTDEIVFPYVFSVFGQNISTELSKEYTEHPEQAEKPLTDGEKELFAFYLEDVVKPVLTEIIGDIRAGKYRTLNEIEEEIIKTFPNTKIKDIIADKEKCNIFNSISNVQYRPRNDFHDIMVKYAKSSGFSDRIRKGKITTIPEPPEYIPGDYTRVFSNPLARSIMNMYTSEEIQDNKADLLDTKKRYRPGRRDDFTSEVVEIVVKALESGKFTACWGTTEKRLFALYNEFICKSGSNADVPFVLSLDDYIKKCGLSSSASGKKETQKVIKNALYSMATTHILTPNANTAINLFQYTHISKGKIYIMGTNLLIEAISEKNQSMFLPPEYFTYKGKNAVSFMNVVQALCFNYGYCNNINHAEKFKSHRNEKISVRTLLSSTDIITIEEVKKQEASWRTKIKTALETILDTFLKPYSWSYIYKGKPTVAEDLPNTLTYSEWEQLVIRYHVEAFPMDTVTQAIATKREKAVQRKQIQADKATIARDRIEQRQEKKARKARKALKEQTPKVGG